MGIYAVTGFFWGLGSLVGPLAAGLFMHAHGHGFALMAALGCGAFAVAAWRLRGTT
ncbi:hypothetical protein [Xanthobacter sp. KR7-225]|uniref:hypothetical protein n=1 Tax=Xanthobacter sp. KR7-225 TaxID=3156613 RepID=UPI0032B5AE49